LPFFFFHVRTSFSFVFSLSGTVMSTLTACRFHLRVVLHAAQSDRLTPFFFSIGLLPFCIRRGFFHSSLRKLLGLEEVFGSGIPSLRLSDHFFGPERSMAISFPSSCLGGGENIASLSGNALLLPPASSVSGKISAASLLD